MKSTHLSLIAGTVALAAITGFASLNVPEGPAAAETATASSLPVERSSLVCPAPSTSDLAETAYTSFTPPGKGEEAARRTTPPS